MISTLEPAAVWKHFAALCEIPRPSSHEQKACEYVIGVAKARGLQWRQDKIGNVVVKKAGHGRGAAKPAVVLQAHLDMVTQKNNATKHDFLKDPIAAYVDGDWVRARGTTLGADNGIGAASALAVLESSDLDHPPIEALFTVDEEAGMTGVANLDPSLLTGRRMLNLDTEDDEEICVGCAGGMDGLFTRDLVRLKAQPAGMSEVDIQIKGLRGGHSGVDIHLGRGNSNKILARFILEARSGAAKSLLICDWHGGNLRNAIPREASARVLVNSAEVESLSVFAREFQKKLANELGTADPGLVVEVVRSNGSSANPPLEQESALSLLRAVTLCLNGIIRMSPDVAGLVESSNNLASVHSEGSTLHINTMFRSSVDSALDDIALQLSTLFTALGFTCEFKNRYSGWQPRLDTELFKITQSVYETAHVRAIHAGLECGYFTRYYPEMEMVSIGPTIQHPHSPDERVSIASVGKFWAHLTRILAAM